MQDNHYQDPLVPPRSPSRLTRLSVITGAGLLATLVAAGLGGAASAQTVIEEPSTPAESVVLVQPGDDDIFESSPEDEAVWQQFEQCLSDAGISEDDLAETAKAAPDEASLEAAFEQCDPILEGLSADAVEVFGDFGELSEADEAVFDEYDECLERGGIEELFGDDVDDVDVDEAAIDALFEQCDPILEGLSADAQLLFEDCPDDEQHEMEGADA